MNSKVEKKNFDDYLKEAQSWETDKVKTANKMLRVAYWYGGVASAVAVMASAATITMALASMNPAPPPVIRVDSSTGIVDVVKSIKDAQANYGELLNSFFAKWYVRYREGYSQELAEDYYARVGIMSSSLEQQKYFEFFNPKNPQSPMNVYGPYAKVKIDIKGTSFIKPNVGLVRYTKKIERGLDKPQVTHWVATIIFKYSGAVMDEKAREINPLGFQVLEYRNDLDAIVLETTTPPKQNSASAPIGVTVFPGQGAPTPAVPAIQ